MNGTVKISETLHDRTRTIRVDFADGGKLEARGLPLRDLPSETGALEKKLISAHATIYEDGDRNQHRLIFVLDGRILAKFALVAPPVITGPEKS